MKKRILCTLLAVLFTLSLLAGCASTSSSAPAASAAPAASTAEPAEPGDAGSTADAGTDALRVAVVVNQRFGDKGPMDDLAAGARRAEADFGIELKLLESASAANFEEDVRAMAKEGYDVIITTFGYMTDATKLIASEYPDTKFAAIFQFINIDESIPNIWDTEFHGEGAFYLGGFLAGMTTQSGKVGMVVGAEEPTPNAEGNAFMRGVRDANPDASVEFAFVGSYEDPAKAKEITNAMISSGCDIVQTDAGASNAGVVEACQDAGILCAGEITDFYDQYDGFMGIIGIGFGATAYQGIEAAIDGTYPGGEHGIMDLNNGGYFMDWASYERFAAANVEFGPALAEAIEAAKAKEKEIMDGSFAVEFDTEVPNWGRISGE